MGFLSTPTSEDEHLVYMTPKSKSRQTLVSVIVGIIVILIIIGAAWFVGKKQAQQAAKDTIDSLNARVQELENRLKEEPAVVNPVSPTIDLQLLHSKIEAISELATVKYLYTDASEFSNSKQFINWNVPGTKKSFILKWDGTFE